MPILGPCPLDTHVDPLKTIWGPHIHVGWEVITLFLMIDLKNESYILHLENYELSPLIDTMGVT